MSALEGKSPQIDTHEATIEQKLGIRYTEIAQTSFEVARHVASLAIVEKLSHRDIYEKYTIADPYKEQLSERYMSITRQSLELAVKLGRLSTNEDSVQQTEADVLAFPSTKNIELANLTAHLTKREREMLELVASGHSNAEIARQKWVTEQTVKFHLSNVYDKLGVRNRTAAGRIYTDLLASGGSWEPSSVLPIRTSEAINKKISSGYTTGKLIDLLKSKIGEPLTYTMVGEILYDKGISNCGHRAGILMRNPSVLNAIAAENIYLERMKLEDLRGLEQLHWRTVVFVPRELQEQIKADEDAFV